MSSNKSTINSAQKKFKNKNLITTEIIHISNEHLPTILEVSFTETLNVTPDFPCVKINRVYGLFGTKLYDNIESSRRARMNDAAPSWRQSYTHQRSTVVDKLIRLNYFPLTILK